MKWVEWGVAFMFSLAVFGIIMACVGPAEADDTGPWEVVYGPKGRSALLLNTETGEVYHSLTRYWSPVKGNIWRPGVLFD